MNRSDFYQEMILRGIDGETNLETYDKLFGSIMTQEDLDEVAARMPRYKRIMVETPYGAYPMLVDAIAREEVIKYLSKSPMINVK